MSSVRAFVLSGVDAAAALDWLHVHGDVDGVLEGDASFTVYTRSSLPVLPFAAVSVHEVAVSADSIEATGLENDAPILVADDLMVRPPWVERPPGFVGVELVVPRGNAFGSGEHASTKAALRCMHRSWNSPASVADVGTGSGILALYAAVRGCDRIEACDIEEPAVVAARELLSSARVQLGGPDTLGACDCVVANMTGTELTASMQAILRCWTRRSALVLSGMRAHEVDAVVAMVDAPVVDRETIEAFTAVVFRA